MNLPFRLPFSWTRLPDEPAAPQAAAAWSLSLSASARAAATVRHIALAAAPAAWAALAAAPAGRINLEISMTNIAKEKLDVGDEAWVAIRLTDAAGNAADPAGLKVSIKPCGQPVEVYLYGVDPALTRTGAGLYALRWPCRWPGRAQVRVETTGPHPAAEPGFFDVRPPNL